MVGKLKVWINIIWVGLFILFLFLNLNTEDPQRAIEALHINKLIGLIGIFLGLFQLYLNIAFIQEENTSLAQLKLYNKDELYDCIKREQLIKPYKLKMPKLIKTILYGFLVILTIQIGYILITKLPNKIEQYLITK